MNTLTFRNSEALKEVAYQTAHSDLFSVPYTSETTSEKSFCLVKDEGIYIMDNYINDDKRTSAEKGTVIYADGYDLDQDDLWEKTYFVSSDDFAESIHISNEQLIAIMMGADLVIKLSDTSYSVTTKRGA